MTESLELFRGIAVLIDDEVHTEGTNVAAIKAHIEGNGCHVVPLERPPDRLRLENLRQASFFILDWNLETSSISSEDGPLFNVPFPASLKKENEAKVIDFLKLFKQIRFAPVFIFTDGDVADIKECLDKVPELGTTTDPSHILVMSKSDVNKKGVFNVLTEWLETAPSVLVLKTWEKQYDEAKNQLFQDFYIESTYWPLILWKSYDADSLPPSAMLGELMAGNLISRMLPLKCDLASYMPLLESVDSDSEIYRTATRQVIEGERFLKGERLHDDTFEPGDIFKDGKSYWINIRPACDCIGGRDGQSLDDIELYLLKGGKMTEGQLERSVDRRYGKVNERDMEAILFPILDGKAISFQFDMLAIKKVGDMKSKRVGRLLPPYLTRLQERYAAYLQRPGLMRLPEALFKPEPVVPILKPGWKIAIADSKIVRLIAKRIEKFRSHKK